MNFYLYLSVFCLGVAAGILWGFIFWLIERKYHK
jgi:hypothetical protein